MSGHVAISIGREGENIAERPTHLVVLGGWRPRDVARSEMNFAVGAAPRSGARINTGLDACV